MRCDAGGRGPRRSRDLGVRQCSGLANFNSVSTFAAMAGWVVWWFGAVCRVVFYGIVWHACTCLACAFETRVYDLLCVLLYTAIVLELVCCVTHSISIPRKSTCSHTYITFSSGETNKRLEQLVASLYQHSSHSFSPPLPSPLSYHHLRPIPHAQPAFPHLRVPLLDIRQRDMRPVRVALPLRARRR
jgi:hypothetical protein